MGLFPKNLRIDSFFCKQCLSDDSKDISFCVGSKRLTEICFFNFRVPTPTKSMGTRLSITPPRRPRLLSNPPHYNLGRSPRQTLAVCHYSLAIHISPQYRPYLD